MTDLLQWAAALAPRPGDTPEMVRARIDAAMKPLPPPTPEAQLEAVVAAARKVA
jgi:hypothetical protein